MSCEIGRGQVRIAVVSHTYAIALNRQKLDCLASQGFTLEVIVPQRRHEVLRVIDVERRPNEPYALIGLRTWPNHPAALAYAPWRLFGALTAFRPHILHIEEEPHSVATGQALMSLLLPPLHQTRLVYFTWRNIDDRFPAPFNWIERQADRRADRIIVGNEDARRLVVARGVKPERVVKIPQLGVDLDTFYPRPVAGTERRPQERPLLAGYVGRLVPEKGLDTLLHAVQAAGPRVHLQVRGAGPDRDHLVALAHDLGVADRVVFLPSVPHDDVAAAMRGLDALVLPSRTTAHWKEQFGHVLVEAMACGVPVIGSDSGAIPEVIGDAGLIFAEGNAEALARLLIHIAQNDNLRQTLRSRGLERVRTMYQQRVLAQKLADVYADLLGHTVQGHHVLPSFSSIAATND